MDVLIRSDEDVNHRTRQSANGSGAERGWNASNKKVLELQARIDVLMLEFCPKEMTAEQKVEWEKAIESLKQQPNNPVCTYRPIPNIYRQA